MPHQPLIALALLPLLVSGVALLVDVGDGFLPAGDVAGIELRTRDVGQRPVLLGLFSREGWSHPGPILFYLLALPYRLVGAMSVGLHLGALLINGGAIAGMAVIARRRGGNPALLLVLLGCSLLVRSFGADFMRDPWNVSVTVLPFGLFLFLVWNTTCGRVWSLPLAAGVGSYCVQTHVGYGLLVVPLLVWGLAWLAFGPRRSLGRAGVVTAAALAVLWLPPLIEEVAGGDSNISTMAGYFLGDHEEESHTLTEGYRVVSDQFGPAPNWLTAERETTEFTDEPTSLESSALPIFLFALPAAGLVLWRRRLSAGLLLVLTVAVALGLGVLSVARTIGPVYDYRLGWLWVVAMIAFMAMAWAGWVSLAPHLSPATTRGIVSVVIVALGALSAVNAADAATAGVPEGGFAAPGIEELARATTRALPAGDGEIIVRCAGDEGCVYHAGLMLWFERRGIDGRVEAAGGLVGSDADHRVHREGAEVKGVLDIEVAGPFKDYRLAADRPGERMVAYWGEISSQERTMLVAEVGALDRDYEAGRIEREPYFIERSQLGERLSSPAVAVYLE